MAELTETMRANRTAHQERYETAYEAYRQKAIEALSKRLEKAQGNETFDLYFSLPVPENHLKDYDRALSMLGRHTESKIVLDAQEYSRFVDDQWDWKSRFEAVNSTYVAD